jgi:long-chain acyl-CoA synthetase
MASGGAATSKVVLEFFEDIGVSVLEGYGLTETSPIITSGALEWENRRLGCVGVPILGVTVRIINPETLEELPADTDGEITTAGPNVMVGYRKNPAANEESFYTRDDKRFFRTGDMGRMVDGKFLKITGRIKEQFKLENGKYVVPAPMEDVFGRSPFIAQTFLYGDNKKHTIALMVPNMLEVVAWVEAGKAGETKDLAGLLPSKEQLADTSVSTLPLFSHPVFVAKIDAEIHRVGSHLKNYEKPGAWTAILHPFSQENQQLTPKMSLRRNNILSAYQPLIDAIYKGEQGHKLTRLTHTEDEEQVKESLKPHHKQQKK